MNTVTILDIIIIFLLLCISITLICIAWFLHGILFTQKRIMETFIVIQLQHSELTEQATNLVEYIYGIDFPRKIVPPQQRQAGQ
jgi:hypothetical protein